jgi:hypothetical protein
MLMHYSISTISELSFSSWQYVYMLVHIILRLERKGNVFLVWNYVTGLRCLCLYALSL